jgi:chaperone BCS1
MLLTARNRRWESTNQLLVILGRRIRRTCLLQSKSIFWPGQHSAKPLDAATLADFAKKFADSIPEEEFSVAALQGCEFANPALLLVKERIADLFLKDLLKNKSQPDAAANGAAEWVISERQMRERLLREKEERELKEKAEVCFSFFKYITCCRNHVLILCFSVKRGGRRRRRRRQN